jgi:dihydroorotate dehydrogenase electron transfer subunit
MTDSPAKKGIFDATVIQNRSLGDKFCRLTLELEKKANIPFSHASAGQFIEIDVSKLALPEKKIIPEQLLDAARRDIILRRPFSFADIECNNNTTVAEILYCVLGPATLRMKTLKTGDTINFIGPLGSGFKLPENKKLAILVAGGMGSPPLIHLAKILRLKCPDTEVIAFVGAKTLAGLAFFDIQTSKLKKKTDIALGEFSGLNIKTFISTDDGSAGVKGFVSQSLENWLKQNKPDSKDTIVYTCGPEAMISATAALSRQFKLPCQVSLERRMACGTGLCQSCAVKCLDKAGGNILYKLCCKDGPVFWSDEVVWE